MQRDKRGRFVKKATNGMAASLNNPSGAVKPLTLNLGSPIKKTKYNLKNGLYIDEFGNVLNMLDVTSNPDKYERDYGLQVTPTFLGTSIPTAKTSESTAVEVSETSNEEEFDKNDPSAGRNLFDNVKGKIGESLGNAVSSISKTKLADYLEYARAGITAGVNNKIAERALEAEKPFL